MAASARKLAQISARIFHEVVNPPGVRCGQAGGCFFAAGRASHLSLSLSLSLSLALSLSLSLALSLSLSLALALALALSSPRVQLADQVHAAARDWALRRGLVPAVDAP
jgi:hypothetical protein